jgi:dephospho-CoA kinase
MPGTMQSKMIVIGLTGNIGTGKSTVREILAGLGATTIDSDTLGHELLDNNKKIFSELLDMFGQSILGEDNRIDRKKLADIAFRDREAQLQLNRIMHITIDEEVRRRIEQYRERGDRVVVVEAALLVEASMNLKMDYIWVTVAPRDVILSRLKNQKGLSEEEILARFDKQMSQEEKITYADTVIDTDCSLEELREKVTMLWHNLDPVSDPDHG